MCVSLQGRREEEIEGSWVTICTCICDLSGVDIVHIWYLYVFMWKEVAQRRETAGVCIMHVYIEKASVNPYKRLDRVSNRRWRDKCVYNLCVNTCKGRGRAAERKLVVQGGYVDLEWSYSIFLPYQLLREVLPVNKYRLPIHWSTHHLWAGWGRAKAASIHCVCW